MNRIAILGSLVLAGTLTAVMTAQQPPPQPSVDNLTVEKVKDNLWVIRGGGGNTAVFETANGVTVVDTKNPGWGQPLLDKIKTVTDKPVTTVINTHTHYDHVSGNVAMPATVEIIAHENTAKMLPAVSSVTGIGATENVFKANPGKGLAKRTFKDRLTIGAGADQINLYHVGPAHTGGDAFVEFVAHRVMHAGDVFPSKALPIMDKNNGGSGVEYAATVRKAVDAMKNVETVINGHTAEQTTLADMREFADFVAEFVAHVQAAKKAGKTAAQAVAEWKNPEKYTGYAPPNIPRATAYAQVIMDESR
ncbi:MAG TPA: MBL fold metallo-hydrolase [Vicinamibacterales bacterium]|nr:MBL fold metallo-hydrolase [Vicinamibacterales bacterium]